MFDIPFPDLVFTIRDLIIYLIFLLIYSVILILNSDNTTFRRFDKVPLWLIGVFLVVILIIAGKNPYIFSTFAILITLIYSSVLDVRERRVPFRTWGPMVCVSIPAVMWIYFQIFTMGSFSDCLALIIMSVIFTFMFYIIGRLHLFGGADAWAFIFLSLTLPVYPWLPLTGYPAVPYLPYSVLINSVIANLIAPVILFAYNIIKRNKAPFLLLLIGYPVDGDKIQDSFGFVMEDFVVKDDTIERRYLGLTESVTRMISGKERVYTKYLKEYPLEYKAQREIYRQAGKVWISYGVPFILPITFGLVSSVLTGDLINLLIRIILPYKI